MTGTTDYQLKGKNVSDQSIEAQVQAKSLTAPRVSLAELDANIQHTEIVKYVSRSGQVLRWAVLTVKNGFSVTGRPSVAVSSENDNKEVGETVAIENARNELWPLMGYALKQKLHETKPTTFQERVIQERNELENKIKALALFSTSEAHSHLTYTEQQDLRSQHNVMVHYSAILADRIARFGSAA